MIVSLRTVVVPPEWRGRYPDWIEVGRESRPGTEVAGGYLNRSGLTQHDPSPAHPTDSQEQS